MVTIGVEQSVKTVLQVNIKHYLLQLVRLVHFVQLAHGHLRDLHHVACVLQVHILLHKVHLHALLVLLVHLAIMQDLFLQLVMEIVQIVPHLAYQVFHLHLPTHMLIIQHL